MNKLLGLIAGASLFLVAGTAGAATNITHLTLDGKTNVTVDEGDSVDARVVYDLTSGDDVESASWEIVDSGLPKTCVNVSDRITDGTFNSSFTIDTDGASEGTWDVQIRLFGTNGEGSNQNCEGSADDTMTFTNRITVEESNDDDLGGDDDNMPSWLKALLAALGVGGSNPPTPAPSTKCAAVNAKLVGTVDNTYNQANVQLQGYLLSEGMSIPALAAGASFGYKGPQTNAALAQFKAQNQCI